MRKSIGRSVSILYRKNQVYLNKALKPFEITGAELPFLMTLYEAEGVSQEELASYLLIDKASTTRALQSLVEKGYIIRRKDETDKRTNRIFLCDKALDNQKAIQKVLDDWNDILSKNIKEESLHTFLDVLDKMTREVEQLELHTTGDEPHESNQ
ncbi:MAG: MarR family transcriptional regulator [Acholeplasma sp.]|nr:MarR family transcriptional regulator [Acholeplasma sp.]